MRVSVWKSDVCTPLDAPPGCTQVTRKQRKAQLSLLWANFTVNLCLFLFVVPPHHTHTKVFPNTMCSKIQYSITLQYSHSQSKWSKTSTCITEFIIVIDAVQKNFVPVANESNVQACEIGPMTTTSTVRSIRVGKCDHNGSGWLSLGWHGRAHVEHQSTWSCFTSTTCYQCRHRAGLEPSVALPIKRLERHVRREGCAGPG